MENVAKANHLEGQLCYGLFILAAAFEKQL
jgi:hypothetical protein